VLNIGIYSSSMQQGKTTIANYIVNECNYSIVTFARPMKDMITVLLESLGYDDTMVRRMLYGDLKEWTIPELSTESHEVTCRLLLVTLGSKWGREMINQDMWINMATSKLDKNSKYVCEDVRLFNEAECLRRNGFKIIRVINPRIPLVDSISEGKLDNYPFDYTIMNDGSVDDLYSRIHIMLTYLENTK